LRYWLSNLTGKDFDSLELLKKLNTPKSGNLDEQKWRHIAWLWYEPLSKTAAAEPDIVQTLTCLKESGLKLGILSNTFINASVLEKHLEQFGMLEFFDVRMYSYQFDFRKPNLRIFEAVAEKIAEPPQNIMFVGDRLDNDITPAIKCGMTAVLKDAYTNTNKPLPPAAAKISRLSELPPLIQKTNSRR
jgi:HAD superfamily hydrolase (TIGR01549 family)